MFISYFRRSFLPLGMVLATLLTVEASAESWTSLNGSRTIQAKMVGLWGDSVVLEMEDGRRVTVGLSNLIAESRIQAKTLAAAQAKTRATIANEFKARAEEAAAPAPNPIPKPAAAPPYVQPQPDAAVIEQLNLVDQQSRAGHIVAAFDALPPSYRKDLSEIAKIGAAKINADAWESLIAAIHSVGDGLVPRQRWLFSHPRFKSIDEVSLESIQDVTLLVAGLIRDGLDPQALSLETLQTVPLRDWIMQRDQAMAPYLAAIGQYTGGMNQQTFELVSEQDGVANVKVTAGELSATIPYSKVEGFWVPKDWADHWTEWMTQTREKLQETPEGSLLTDPMIVMIPGTIEPIVGPLKAATDRQGFHSAMENMFTMAAPIASLAGLDMSGKRRRGADGFDEGYPDSYPEGYGEEMDTEMDEDYPGSSYPGSSGAPTAGAPGRGAGSSGPRGAGSSGPSRGAGSSGSSRAPGSSGPSRGAGTGGSSDANPNIGARLEDTLRGGSGRP